MPEKAFEGGGDGDSAYTSRIRNDFAAHALRPRAAKVLATAAGLWRRKT